MVLIDLSVFLFELMNILIGEGIKLTRKKITL